MFDKFLNSIIHDNNTRMYVGAAIVIYIACLTDMVPNQFKKLLKEPIVKMLVLAGIAYLSTINFEGSLMVTIIYFATANCMSYEENFTDMLTRNEDGSYLVNSMQDGIKSYSDARTLNPTNRANLKRWGKAAETDQESNTKPAGQCYKNLTASVVSASTEAVGEAVANIWGQITGETAGFDNMENFTAEEENRCGHVELAPVAECAGDDAINPYANGEETFAACGAAYAKWETRECKYTNDLGQCLDTENGAVVTECIEGPLSENCPIDNTQSVIKSFKSDTDNTPFEGNSNITLDYIKNTYLKQLVDTTREIGTEEGAHKQDSNNNYIYKLTKQLQDQITRLNDPTIPVTNNNGKDLKYKLLGNYRYLYEFSYSGSLPTDSDYASDSFIIPETGINTYIVNNSTEIPTKIRVDEITSETKGTYFELDAGEYKYYPKINPDYDGSANNNQYITEEGIETNNESEAGKQKHPLFVSPAKDIISKYEKYDIYDRYKPRPVTIADIMGLCAIHSAAHVVGASQADKEIYAVKEAEVEEQQKTDKKTQSDWNTAKSKWENDTAKKIMRSIGCHRLRDPLTDTYGYWGNAGTEDSKEMKCIYEKISQV